MIASAAPATVASASASSTCTEATAPTRHRRGHLDDAPVEVVADRPPRSGTSTASTTRRRAADASASSRRSDARAASVIAAYSSSSASSSTYHSRSAGGDRERGQRRRAERAGVEQLAQHRRRGRGQVDPHRCAASAGDRAPRGRRSAATSSASDSSISSASRSTSRHGVAVAVDAVEDAAVVGGERHRQGLARGQRQDREHLGHPRAGRVERQLRPGHVGHHQVEHPAGQSGSPPARRARAASAARSRSSAASASAPTARPDAWCDGHRVAQLRQPQHRVGFADRQVDEQRANDVPRRRRRRRSCGVVRVGHAHRHQRAHRRSPAAAARRGRAASRAARRRRRPARRR